MGTKKRFPEIEQKLHKVRMHSQDMAKLNDATKANENYTKKIEYSAWDDRYAAITSIVYHNPDRNLDERVKGDLIGESNWFKKAINDALDYHRVVFSCTHGSVSAYVGGEEIFSGNMVKKGTTVKFMISPDGGYQYQGSIDKVIVNEVINADVTNNFACTPAIPDTFDFFMDFNMGSGETLYRIFESGVAKIDGSTGLDDYPYGFVVYVGSPVGLFLDHQGPSTETVKGVLAMNGTFTNFTVGEAFTFQNGIARITIAATGSFPSTLEYTPSDTNDSTLCLKCRMHLDPSASWETFYMNLNDNTIYASPEASLTPTTPPVLGDPVYLVESDEEQQPTFDQRGIVTALNKELVIED